MPLGVKEKTVFMTVCICLHDLYPIIIATDTLMIVNALYYMPFVRN